MIYNIYDREDTKFEKEIIFSPDLTKLSTDFDVNNSSCPVEDLWETNLFLEGVRERLRFLGVDSNLEETEELKKAVKARYDGKGMGAQYSRTVKEWLNGTKPSTNQTYKENCYIFCMAMDMNLPETVEFLLKHFQVLPFNFKNRVDAVYFYGIKEGKMLPEIQVLLEKSEGYPEKTETETSTRHIGRSIYEIDNDEEFLLYLRECCYSSEYQFMTAKKYVLDLVDRCKDLLGKKDMSDSRMLKEITGYNNQVGFETGGRLHIDGDKGGGISKTGFPKKFKEDFPDGTEISKIRNGKKVSAESVRKILIILKLFEFYASRDMYFKDKKINQEEIDECRDDFCIETNSILAECGYVMLYGRNLFDWYILWSLNSVNPVKVLKKIIEENLNDII